MRQGTGLSGEEDRRCGRAWDRRVGPPRCGTGEEEGGAAPGLARRHERAVSGLTGLNPGGLRGCR
jgi:hypothetical protein